MGTIIVTLFWTHTKLPPAPSFLKDEKIFAQSSSQTGTSHKDIPTFPTCLVMRTFPFHELEKAMIKWFNIMREQKVAVSGSMVQEKALEYANGTP